MLPSVIKLAINMFVNYKKNYYCSSVVNEYLNICGVSFCQISDLTR